MFKPEYEVYQADDGTWRAWLSWGDKVRNMPTEQAAREEAEQQLDVFLNGIAHYYGVTVPDQESP